MLVAFDREEQGVVGSRVFCETPPLPLAGCAAAVVMDQLGRSALDMHPGTLLGMGAESSAALEAAVAAAGAPEGGRIASLGIDFNPGTSDYEPFLDLKQPFVFLTSGPHEDYHRPTDLPDRLDYAALTARTDWVARLVAAVADGKDRPAWRDPPAPRVEEVKTVRDLVGPIVPQAAEFGLPPFLQVALKNFHAAPAEARGRGHDHVGAARRRREHHEDAPQAGAARAALGGRGGVGEHGGDLRQDRRAGPWAGTRRRACRRAGVFASSHRSIGFPRSAPVCSASFGRTGAR